MARQQTGSPPADVEIDLSQPNPARMHNYWLGGKDHFAADRELADKMIATLPDQPVMVRANRRFLAKAVRRLVTEFGISQLIEIGSGFPTACNIHEVAQDLDPTARVLYVDHDPLVAAHSRALLTTSTASGRCVFLAADARRPEQILDAPELTTTLDLQQPVAVLLVSILEHLPDDLVHHTTGTLLDALPAGSFATISHLTADWDPHAVKAIVDLAADAGITYRARSGEEVAELLAGLDLVDPGIVPLLDWQPDFALRRRHPHAVHCWVGMARTPERDRP